MTETPYSDKGLDAVDEFSRAFDLARPGEPTIPEESDAVKGILDTYHANAAALAAHLKDASAYAGGSLTLIRLQLIQEELAELAAGLLRRDPVEVLDALVDLSYVVDGAYISFGLAGKKLDGIAEVHRSNMTKLDEDGKPVIGPSGRVLKSDQYRPPNLRAVLEGES